MEAKSRTAYEAIGTRRNTNEIACLDGAHKNFYWTSGHNGVGLYECIRVLVQYSDPPIKTAIKMAAIAR